MLAVGWSTADGAGETPKIAPTSGEGREPTSPCSDGAELQWLPGHLLLMLCMYIYIFIYTTVYIIYIHLYHTRTSMYLFHI